MATPPLWNEIESNPTFQGLAPEQKSKVLSGWSQQVLELAKTPEEKLAIEAVSDAKLKFFTGTPMPENMGEYVKTYAQQKAQQEVDAQAKEKADRPFFGFGDTLNALGTIASNLPTNVKAAAYQLKEGLAMPSERSQGYLDAMAEKRAADEAVQAEQAQREAQGSATSVGSAGREFSNSSGFSGVAMGAALAGGAAGSATGTAIGTAVGAGATLPAAGVGAAPGAGAGSIIGATVGAIGGLASSGTAAYRMAGATFLDDAFDMANKQSVEEKGRPLNKEEEKSLYDKILPIAQNTALWEAGPEAIGNVFTMGVGKLIFKGPAKEIATTFAKKALRVAGLASADVGVELAGETATQVGGQGWDQAKLEAILAGKNPDEVANPYAGAAGIAKGFEEIAPATLFGSALMGGGAGLVGLAKDQYIKAQAAKAQQIADTAAALAATNSTQALNALVQTAVEVASTPPVEEVAPVVPTPVVEEVAPVVPTVNETPEIVAARQALASAQQRELDYRDSVPGEISISMPLNEATQEAKKKLDELLAAAATPVDQQQATMVVYELTSPNAGKALDLDEIEMAVDNIERGLQKGNKVDWAREGTLLPNIGTAEVGALKGLVATQEGRDALRAAIEAKRSAPAPAKASAKPLIEEKVKSTQRYRPKEGVEVTNIDEIVTNGGGVVSVTQEGRPVNFDKFGVAIDGDTAEVAFVELASNEQGKGLGKAAYIALGTSLAKKGITLKSSKSQYAKGRNLWAKLAQEGYATKGAQGVYTFTAPAPVEETSPVRPAATTVKVAAKPIVRPTPAKAPEVRVTPVAAPVENPKGASLTKQWKVVTPITGTETSGEYELVESDSLVTSDKPTYDQKLQPRDRTRLASKEQVANIAANHQPQRTGESETTDLGAPMVDAKNQVLSGNGRTQARRMLGPDKEANYRNWLAENAEKFGFSQEELAAMKQPILIRRIKELGGMTPEAFAEESNKQQVLGMSDAEKASSDARMLLANPSLMDQFRPSEEGDVLAASNRGFLNAFIQGTGATAELTTADGYNESALNKRVKNAILAALLGPENRNLITALTERSEALGIVRVTNGILAVAPQLVKLQGTPHDLSPMLSKALTDLVALKESGEKLGDFLAQGGLFADPARTGTTDYLLTKLHDAKSAKAVIEPMMKYVSLAANQDTTTEDMFGGGITPPAELLKIVYESSLPTESQTDLSFDQPTTPVAEAKPPTQKASGSVSGETREVAKGKTKKERTEAKPAAEKPMEAKPALPDPATLTNAQINKEKEKLSEARDSITTRMIAAGRGTELSSETMQKSDPLAREFQEVVKRTQELNTEAGIRMGGTVYGALPTDKAARTYRRKQPTETKPATKSEQPTESATPTEAPQLTERQQARIDRKKVTKEKLDDLAARRKAAEDTFRKTMGRTSMAGFDSEQFTAALELAKISAETGAVKFMDFAQDVRDQFPDLWNDIKNYLSGVWNQLALENEELEEAPSPREARKLLAQIETEETPVVEEEAPPVTEKTPIVEEEETPVLEEEEPTTEKFPENSPSILSLTEKITFGKSRGKTIAAVFREGKAEYLFKTLFAPAAAEGANAKEVEKLRPLIAQTEEYKAYQKEQSMTDTELAASRKPFTESNKLSNALNNLQVLGYDAKLLPDGSVAITATGPAVANKEAIASSGFSYDNKKGWVSKTYERVVSLANLAVSQEAGQPMGAEAVSDANIAKIRTEQRDKLADQADQSKPPAGKSARPFMTKAVFEFFQKALSRALGQEAVKGGKVSIPSNALMEQQWDSMLISKAQADGKPMYLLSSSAGTGKTFVMGAALANIRSRMPEARIVFVTRSQELIKQAKGDFANFPEAQNIEFITYANLDNKENKAEFTPSDSDVLVFDEAHEIRYGLSDTSSRSKKAAEWMSKAKFTLLTTATPYESIEQMEYLKATGVFDSLKDVKGLFDDGWFNFASIAGAKVLQREGKPSSIEFDKMSEADKMAGQLYAREFLRKNGMFSQRNAIIPDGMSEANFQSVTGSAKWKNLAEAIQTAFKLVKKPSSNDKGFYTNILKRVLEASKEEAAIDLARREAAEGRQVVIFVETKSETNRDLEEIVAKWDAAQAEYAAAKAIDPAAKFVVPDGVPNLPGVIEMFRNMIAAGATEIKFESAQEKFKRAFGDQVAFYTGDEAGAVGEDSLSRWQNPDAPNSVPILVATMARGGTGLSLHDKSDGGKYPRTQIMLNLPWRASEVEQVAGRTVRYGMTSVARSFWLFANNLLNESSLASRVGERLKSMNMLVRGEITLAADKIDSKDWSANPFTGEVTEMDRSLPTPIGGEMAENLAEDVRTSLSEQVPSGKVVGGITEQNAKNGLDLIAKLIPMARRMVRLATSAELLADETLTPAERASVRSGAQGYYSKGKVVLITDQVKQTVFHKNADIAAAAIILHEMMHHGTSVIRGSSNPLYASWLKLVSEYVTDAQIKRLVEVQGYSAYADWRTDMAVKEKAMEEIFVRQLEGLFVRKGSLSFVEKNKLQKFLSWLKEFVNSALGLPQGTQIPDSHLEEMGAKFVSAISSAQFVERTQDVRESAADLGSLPPENQTSLLSPYNDEEKASLADYKKANPELGLKFSQILGLEDASIADVQSIQASETLAYEYLQLSQDPKTGRPVVEASDVNRLLGIATQLTARESTFGSDYQVGKPDAATGVLQMVLTQAGLEMARNGDPRLIKMLRQNWNGIVMGAFLTHSSAGRLLQSRSAYKNEILDTMYELEQATKASATKYLQDQGVEDAENVLRSVEELIQNAQLDAQALEALKKRVSGIKVGAQDTFSERISAALENTSGEIKKAFATLTQEILRRGALAKLVQDMRDKKAASSASQNWLDDMGIGEPLPTFGSLAEAEAALARADKELAKRIDELGKALKKKPKAPIINVTWETPTPPDEGAVEDLEDVEDVKEEENKNEATKAAEAVLSNLKAFLEKKYSKEAKTPTIYAIIKKAVDANIANTPKHTVFEYFAADLEKELEPFDIEDSVKEELIATAWSTSSRYAEKEAEKITDRFLSKKEVKASLKPDNVVKLKALVKEFLRNKKKLEEQDFVDTMAPLVEALNVPAEIAEELAAATYEEHLVRKEAALKRMLERTKASLLAGSRKTLVSQIKAADQADINDAAWQEAALRKVLTLSGILPSELDRAMGVFTEADKAAIFGTTLEKMNKAAADSLNKSVERLTKNYEEYLKRPTNAPKPTPSETLRKLVRNLVALDIGRPLFVTQAAAFGATEAQANRLYDLARTERSLRQGEGTSTTKMDVLIKYITSDASLQNDPALRLEAIKAWLRNNGYTSQAADNAAAAIDAAFEEQVIAAQMKAMENFEIKISSRKQAQLKQKAENANVNVAEKQVKKLQELIRMGLGKAKLDPTKSFAKAAGYENLQPSDYKALGELDIKITQAKADQRIHDYAIGVKELYELLARRKLEMGFLARLAISYNNSALSGLGTLAINIIAPMGAMMTRVGLDMGTAIARGDIQAVKDIFKVLQDTVSIIKNEVKFSITGGANTNDWSRVIMNATSLQQPLVKAMQKINNPRTPALEKLKARMVVVQSWTDVTRRVLMATDHVWFSMLDNYFRKTQALDVMRRAGVQDQAKIDQVKALLFAGTNIYGPRLAYELEVLHRYEAAIEQLRGLPDAKQRILDLITAPLDAEMKIEARKFEEDIRGDIRRASQGLALTQATSVKQALGAVRLQRTLSNIRIRDNVARDINLAIKGILPDIQFPDFVEKESAYEMGVHRGEEAPSLDVVNNIVNAIQGAGNKVIQKHPILGRMLLGYFGIPSNLLNRALWFTPYGLIRYAIAAKTRKDVRVGPNPFYQQSMATNEQIRQRLVEATVGTTAVAILMALKALSDDDDESPFNVTLIGPTNKTELDAWKKAGHRQGSIEIRVGDKIVALNAMRGPFEPLKIALLMVGAMDDMRLNRKENDGEFAQYFSEYLTAMLSGWSKQASFFGAKSTIGATLAVNPDASVVSTALYKLNPIIPFSGLISSVEKLMTGGDRFRGREGSIYLNLPIARSLLTQKAVNALGDPQGLNPSSAWTESNERAWWAGFPLMVSGTPTGNDKKVYEFILDRGIAPGLPQRTALENKNGVMSDSDWQDYVAVRGTYIKRAMIRDLARLRKMDDDSASKALGQISTDATAAAKKQLRYK